MMDNKYFLVVFENGEEWKYEGVQPIPALTEAEKRGTKLQCILYGNENPLGEFVPEKCWDANGNKDDSMLMVELLRRSANSRHPVLAGMAMYAMKKIREENGA
jgi:hypothetical protein